MAARPRLGIVAWCFTDGKAGHENQSRGLIDALGERLPVADYAIRAGSGLAAARDYLRGRFPAAHDLPDPDLIIGAGHATHLPMLAARRARGGRVIVLMQPSLPNAWFDLCVIPEHDRPRQASNVLVTRGALNRIHHVAAHDDDTGLFLVGGPAPQVQWDTASVIAQIRTVLERSPEQHWWLTTSRRTPDDLLPALTNLPDELSAHLTVVPYAETDGGWLPEKLGHAAQVWVTEESVSMVYEALTSGAAIGLLAVPSTQPQGRVARGIEALVREGLVRRFADWEQGSELRVPDKHFDEAGRCADWICKAWLSGR
jgi:mitochondrial fission protein ELM1